MSYIEDSRALQRNWVGWISALLFILTIPLSNWVVVNVGFVCEPNGPCLVPVWPGIMSPSAVLLAGLALVLRDAVHSFLGGRWAIYCIIFGAALSGLLSSPELVVASTAAFLFSETADFLVYTPMRRRYPAWAVIASGLVGSIVDSAIFLSLAFGSIEFIVGQVIGKFWMSLIASAIIVAWHRLHHSRAAIEAERIRA